MKNKRLGLVGMVGLTGLLASCNVTVTPGGGDTLILNGVTSFSSEFELRNTIVDQFGTSYPAGTYVICDNTDTDLTVGYSWSGPLKRVYFQLKGYTEGGSTNALTRTYTFSDFSGSDSFTGVIGAGLAPLKINSGLKRQAITVNPAVTKIKGASYVRVQGEDSFGTTTDIKESATVILIADCS